MLDGTDDDGFDGEAPQGKLLFSGIRSDVKPAAYALPPGEPALQGGEPEWEVVEQPPQALQIDRRKALGLMGGVMALAGVSGYALAALANGGGGEDGDDARMPPGELRGGRIPSLDDVHIEGARSLAEGPPEELLKHHLVYISVLQVHGGDDVLWFGFNRLAVAALHGQVKDWRRLAVRILDTATLHEVPPHLAPVIEQLRDRVYGSTRRPGRKPK